MHFIHLYICLICFYGTTLMCFKGSLCILLIIRWRRRCRGRGGSAPAGRTSTRRVSWDLKDLLNAHSADRCRDDVYSRLNL